MNAVKHTAGRVYAAAILTALFGCSSDLPTANTEQDFQVCEVSQQNEYPNDTMLEDFEFAPADWMSDCSCTLEVSQDYVSHGTSSFKFTSVDPPTYDFPGVRKENYAVAGIWNWTGHETDYIKIDLYNMADATDSMTGFIKVKGMDSLDVTQNYQTDYTYTQGWQCIQIPVTELAFGPENLSKIVYFLVGFSMPATPGDVFYIDALRLGPYDPFWAPPTSVEKE